MWFENSSNQELLNHLHVNDRREILEDLLPDDKQMTLSMRVIINMILDGKHSFVDVKRFIIDSMCERERFVYTKLRLSQIGCFKRK